MRVLDSHLHLWDPDVLPYPWLDGRLLRRFDADDYRDAVDSDTRGARHAAVFVQAECAPERALDEVDFAAAAAPRAGIVAIVARARLEEGDAVAAELSALAERPLVAGVRRLIQDEAPGFATSAAFLAGAEHVAARGFTFDACVRWHQLDEVAELAERVPRLRIVLDHLGKPPLAGPGEPEWRRALQRLAEHRQVFCKLSGLPAESASPSERPRWEPLLDAALDAFGPDRVMFGSDWPVSWPYGAWERVVLEWASRRVPESVAAIFATNAERFYGISAGGAADAPSPRRPR